MARTQIIKNAIINALTISNVEKLLEMNRIESKNLINRILAYSAIKINVNPSALNSVLNPDTSSDSPSEKSKGVRLVSAKVLTNQIAARGVMVIKLNIYCWEAITSFISSDWLVQIKLRRIMMSLTS